MEEKYESLEKALCMELEAIEQKLKGGTEMSIQDLDRVDKLAHAVKSLATYKAMKGAEDYGMMDGFSGRRGMGMNGRYISREGGNSYADGYAQGYSEAMHHPWPYYGR